MPDERPHPEHHSYRSVVKAFDGSSILHYLPAKPLRSSRWWMRFKIEWACRKRGGHWWHPDIGMINWFCCQCGREQDGMPDERRWKLAWIAVVAYALIVMGILIYGAITH